MAPPSEARADLEEFAVRAADGAVLHAVVSGRGTELVAVHGTGTDAEYLRPLLDQLTSRHRCIAHSRRGHGRSEDANEYSIELEARDLVWVSRFLSPMKPVMFGHSYGGTVCLAAAASGHGRAVVVYEPALLLGPDRWAATDAARDLVGQGHDREAVQRMMRDVFEAPSAVVAAVGLMPVAWCTGYARRMLRELTEMARASELDFATIDVPVVVIVGERSPDATAATCADLVAKVAQGDLVVLDGMGHDGVVEYPRLVAEVIADVMQRCDSPSPRPASPPEHGGRSRAQDNQRKDEVRW